jgi:hypothetical protein
VLVTHGNLWLEAGTQSIESVSRELQRNGMQPCTADSSLRYTEEAYLLIYVDDILLAGESTKIYAVKMMLKETFDIKNLGEASNFLGMEIEQR